METREFLNNVEKAAKIHIDLRTYRDDDAYKQIKDIFDGCEYVWIGGSLKSPVFRDKVMKEYDNPCQYLEMVLMIYRTALQRFGAKLYALVDDEYIYTGIYVSKHPDWRNA